MGVFRSKGVEDSTAVQASGEPEIPGRRAVTEVVTTGSFDSAWRIAVGADAPQAPPSAPSSTTASAESEADQQEARHARPDDEIAVSLRGWLREKTQQRDGVSSEDDPTAGA